MEQSFAESKKEDIHEEQMEANEQVSAGACKNEQREEALAMAASRSPTHSSAEDIFSDTMELAHYLQRRVQEIGKQFRHRPFRINTSEKLESGPEFVQGPPRAASEPSLASAIARACEPGELAIARENAESRLKEGGGVPSLAEMKPSSGSCLSKREWNVCAEMKHNERPFNTEMKTYHLYDSRHSDGRICNTEELTWAHREENFPFSSENADNSAQGKGENALLKHREEKLLSVSEIEQVYMCGKHGAHNQGSGMGGTSLKHVNLNTCVDAGSCPTLRRAEGKNPQSQCSIMSHDDSSEHLLCHASSDMKIVPAHFPLDLKLPSLQDHAISDAEDAGGCPRSIHTEIVCPQAVAENSSSPHLNKRHSMSSVDSSECDNCGNDGDNRGGTLSRVSNEADGNKSEEIDAMSEAMHPDTRRKDDEDDTPAELGGDASGRAEPENDALDLLIDAIQVTSTEGAAAKEGADAYQKGACLSGRPGHRSIQNMLNRDNPELPSDTPSLHVGSFPIVKKRSDRSTQNLARGKKLSESAASPVARFRSLQAVSEGDLPNDRKGGKKRAANKLDDQKVERSKTSDSSQGCSKGKRERTWESQQDTLAEEDHFSKQEKREKLIDGDDAQKDTRKEQLPAMPALEGDKQELGMLSRRARLQVLPTKFSDSVLQPWKKGDRRRS